MLVKNRTIAPIKALMMSPKVIVFRNALTSCPASPAVLQLKIIEQEPGKITLKRE